MTDIVTSRLPHWDDTRLWVIARPLSGFAETFSWYVVEVAAGGGSARPDDDADAVVCGPAPSKPPAPNDWPGMCWTN